LNIKNLIVFILDAILVALAFVLSFLFRFDFSLPYAERDIFAQGLCLVILIKPMVFLSVGFYGNLWRYASLRDTVDIFKAVSVSSIVTALFILFLRFFDSFPRSIIVLDWVLLLFLVCSSRLALRLYREIRLSSIKSKGSSTLIIGAGEAGSLLLKEIRRNADSPYNVLGFVDDDDAKQGKYLSGVQVLGKLENLPEIVGKHWIEELIVAIPSSNGKVLRNIVEICRKTGVRFRTLPRMGDIIDGKVSISQLKDVEIDDLLGREPVVLDQVGIHDYLCNKRIIVSGAAGSIGAEICRQVAEFNPKKLILLDSAETPLFYMERELSTKYPDMRIIPIIGDVRNREKMEAVFDEFKPDMVFHAAAYKHVVMMEFNQDEAVSNNIGGTKTLADAAHRFGVGDFVMISTDKAVNPASVMGASKRIAEIYVQALARRSTTKFTTVRFGNVLGSNGSVIPLFMEQIKNGGPVTVTDPNVIRYFMTIPEATQLVLQAGCIGKGGEIFVLDMGEPVRIMYLAEELIRLSGLTPYEDIDIVFTGLCPGEKLFEELLIDGEGIMPTTHDKIRIAAAAESDLDDLNAEMKRLFNLADKFDVTGMMNSMNNLVAEFTPSHIHTGSAPLSFNRPRPVIPHPKKPAAIPPEAYPTLVAKNIRN
jgi:FlaA1/EpsC-like NDP-sugar epimerase